MHWWHQQVLFGDGFSYERSYIEEYVRNEISSDSITMKTQVRSPRTQEMVYAILIANHNLKQAIESWQQHSRASV